MISSESEIKSRSRKVDSPKVKTTTKIVRDFKEIKKKRKSKNSVRGSSTESKDTAKLSGIKSPSTSSHVEVMAQKTLGWDKQ